jgi:hypothetical protein
MISLAELAYAVGIINELPDIGTIKSEDVHEVNPKLGEPDVSNLVTKLHSEEAARVENIDVDEISHRD